MLSDTITVPGLEFVQIDDIATDDLTDALKGLSFPIYDLGIHFNDRNLDVYAVIHVAAPLPGRATLDQTFEVCPPPLLDHRSCLTYV